MRIYVTRLPEGERLEMGRLLLKAGYGVRPGREKHGSAWRHYLEAEPCTKDAAPGGTHTGDGNKTERLSSL